MAAHKPLSMSRWSLFYLLAFFATVFSIAPVVAGSGGMPAPLYGPSDPSKAGYAYSSFVLPSDAQSDLHYEVCNRTDANLAFRWAAAGFELLDNAPLAAHLCALYERSANNFRRLLDTRLEFSSHSAPAKAYVDCKTNPGDGCPIAGDEEGKSSFASLRALIMPSAYRLDGATEVNVEPLYVAVGIRDNKSLGHQVTIEWASTQKRFLLGIPANAKSDLEKNVNGAIATFHSYKKFKELEGNPLMRGYEEVEFMEVGSVNDAANGGWQADIAKEIPLNEGIILAVIDLKDRIVALMEVPTP